MDSDQAEVRSAALDAVEACYVGLDKDSSRIHRLLGAINDKTKTLIDEVRSREDLKNVTCCVRFYRFVLHVVVAAAEILCGRGPVTAGVCVGGVSSYASQPWKRLEPTTCFDNLFFWFFPPQRMKAADRKNISKAPSASQANTRGLRESAAAAPAIPDSEQRYTGLAPQESFILRCAKRFVATAFAQFCRARSVATLAAFLLRLVLMV